MRFLRQLYHETRFRSQEYKNARVVWDKIQSGEFDQWLDYLILAIKTRKETLRRNGET